MLALVSLIVDIKDKPYRGEVSFQLGTLKSNLVLRIVFENDE